MFSNGINVFSILWPFSVSENQVCSKKNQDQVDAKTGSKIREAPKYFHKMGNGEHSNIE